eukprot:SAG11_NODE_1300_length_5261_cov_8.900232_8_plen_239_part_00
MILYYDELEATLGPTTFVPGAGQLGLPPPPLSSERAVAYAPGTALVYRPDVAHRGTPVRAGAARVTQHLLLRTQEAEWVQSDHWIRQLPGVLGGEGGIGSLSPAQRCLLGFPPPGHRRWTRASVAGVAQRYPGWDIGPYLAALAPSPTGKEEEVERELPPPRSSNGWIEPEELRPGPDGTVTLTPAMVRQWRQQGWLALDNLYPADLVTAAGARHLSHSRIEVLHSARAAAKLPTRRE